MRSTSPVPPLSHSPSRGEATSPHGPRPPAHGPAALLPTFCTYEDRPEAIDAVKILCLSMQDHCPGAVIYFYAPQFLPDFQAWVERRISGIKVIHQALETGELKGWSTKPDVLLKTMDLVNGPVCWIDTDIVLAGPIAHLFQDLGPLDILVTSQKGTFDSRRTTVWGLEVRRPLERSINSCILRVTPEHRSLIKLWRKLLHEPLFQQEQEMPHHLRPAWLHGDQDVFEGLLASAAAEMRKEFQLRFLLSCLDVIHEGDFQLRDRMRLIGRGLPPVMHIQGRKPWYHPTRKRLKLRDCAAHLSPYMNFARGYAGELDSDYAREWLLPQPWPVRLSRALMLGSPVLQATPLVLLQRILRR